MNEHSPRKLSKYIELCAKWNSSNSKILTFQIHSKISIIFCSRIIKIIHLTVPASLEDNRQYFQELIKEIFIMISFSKTKTRIRMKKSYLIWVPKNRLLIVTLILKVENKNLIYLTNNLPILFLLHKSWRVIIFHNISKMH